jgi:hypothetical protein
MDSIDDGTLMSLSGPNSNITGQGHDFVGGGSSDQFTVTGSDQAMAFSYPDGGSNTFDLVVVSSGALWLGKSSAPKHLIFYRQ